MKTVQVIFLQSLTALAFSSEQIVRIAGNIGGSKNIKMAIDYLSKEQKHKISKEELIKILSRNSGHRQVTALLRS